MERSRCEACLQTILSGKRSLILVCPPLPSPATPPLGLEGRWSPCSRKAQLRKGTPAPLQAQACCVHPLTRWRRKTHTSPLSLPGTSSPLCPLRENSNAKRWSQRPPELGRLREGGHASAQPDKTTVCAKDSQVR